MADDVGRTVAVCVLQIGDLAQLLLRDEHAAIVEREHLARPVELGEERDLEAFGRRRHVIGAGHGQRRVAHGGCRIGLRQGIGRDAERLAERLIGARRSVRRRGWRLLSDGRHDQREARAGQKGDTQRHDRLSDRVTIAPRELESQVHKASPRRCPTMTARFTCACSAPRPRRRGGRDGARSRGRTRRGTSSGPLPLSDCAAAPI